MNTLSADRNRRILVIDDNRAIHEDFRKILAPGLPTSAALNIAETELFGGPTNPIPKIEFEVDSASQGQEGLALVQSALAAGRPYAMAFVDIRMPPGWDGVETTRQIWAVDPDLQIVICTAYSDYSWNEMFEKLGQHDGLVILKKPFDTVEALQLAHAFTEKWWLHQQSRRKMNELENMVAARTRELQTANEQLKNEMAERARTEEVLRQAQKMEAVGQLAGGIAHDFNNLLTIIRGYVQCLNSEMQRNADVDEALREIDVAAERATKLTSQMLMFSRKKKMQPRSINLNEIIPQLGTMLRRLLDENVALEIETGGPPLAIRADPVMMELIVLNLAVNARDAMPHGGKLLIATREIEIKPEDCQRNPQARPGQFACIRVEDNGSGIAPEVLPHLFEPFFTTKEVGKGTGLGLASVYGVVKQHEGWVEVESEPGHGARFKIFLPLEFKNPKAGTLLPKPVPLVVGSETILLVEDEHSVRRLAKLLLQRQGYRVYEASSGVEALAVWETHGPEIDLLLTDMIMPGGMSGRELAEKLAGKKAPLKIIYTSGYSPDTISQNLMLKEGLNFLPKPYHPDKLIHIIRQRLDEPALAPPALKN